MSLADAPIFLTIAVGALLCTGLAWMAVAFFGRGLMSPFVIVPLTSFFYLTGNTFRALFEGGAFAEDDFQVFFLGCAGLAAFVLGAGLTRTRSFPIDSSRDSSLALAGYILLFAGLAGQLYILRTHGPLFFVEGKGPRNIALATAGPEKFAKDLLVPAQILLSIHYTRIRAYASPAFLLASAAIFCVFFLYEVRGAIIIQLFTFLYFYNRHVGKLKLSHLVFGASALFILGTIGKNIFYVARLWVGGDDASVFGDANPVVTLLTQHEFYAWVEIMKNLRGEFLYGETIVRSLLSALQPGFLGGTSYSPTQWYAERYEAAAAELGYGRAFTFLGELYVNFGVVGMLLALLGSGYVLRRLDDHRRFYFVAAFASGAFPFLWTGNTAMLFKTYGVICLLLPLMLIGSLRFLRHCLNTACTRRAGLGVLRGAEAPESPPIQIHGAAQSHPG